MKELWIKKFKSFAEAEKADEKYYIAMGPTKRVETMQFLRETFLKFGGKAKNDGRKGLRRHITIVQQA
jgi:hypothetical protein